MNATMTRQIQAYRATASPMPVCPFISRQVAVAAAVSKMKDMNHVVHSSPIE